MKTNKVMYNQTSSDGSLSESCGGESCSSLKLSVVISTASTGFRKSISAAYLYGRGPFFCFAESPLFETCHFLMAFSERVYAVLRFFHLLFTLSEYSAI